MIHIPILRHGQAYESVEKVELVHHASGERIARVSQANSGMIVRDVTRMNDASLERFGVHELLAICRRAAERFGGGTLPLGDTRQTYDDYIHQLSATTGMPITFCHNNAKKVHRVLAEMDVIIAGLTRGFDLGILDRGFGRQEGRTLSFFRDGRIFGAVLPSNSPGVHGLWIPAVALKAPIVLKPGREEPWTPYRIVQALIAEGLPAEAVGFYPTDHAGAGELLRTVDRSMLFGDASTTAAWKDDPRVELHGPGYSKVLLDDDTAANWSQYLDIMESSVTANGGRSCINASGVWTPAQGREIALALAERLAKVEALAVDDPKATVAAFANPDAAERMSALIDHELRIEGAEDVTQKLRGTGRFVKRGRVAYLLPTVIWCEDAEHPLANREFLFPFASVVTCPVTEMPDAIGSSLVVSAVTQNEKLIKALMNSQNVDRLNLGPIPTWQLSWDQPHEGNLFEHLYRQRAFQTVSAA
jgi:acyl-CoA reductase-like NAD-dependent aldehyde dehydrogenase